MDTSTSAVFDRTFRRVLICLDRSATAETVVALAEHLAALDAGQVILLHVMEVGSDPASGSITDPLGWEVERRRAQAYLSQIAESLSVPAEVRVLDGSAGARIAATVEEMSVDLVALTTVGEGGPGEWSLGGTARKALSLATCPVLLVPATPEGRAPQVPPRRILVPLDGTKRGESVLSTVTRLGRGAGAEVVLAHVVGEPVATEILSYAEDLDLAQQLVRRQSARAAQYLERIGERLATSGVGTRAVVRKSVDDGEGVLAAGHAQEADLIVISAHGAVCDPRHPLGSVASYVVHHTAIPVLVMQDLPDRARRTSEPPPEPPRPFPRRSADAVAAGD